MVRLPSTYSGAGEGLGSNPSMDNFIRSIYVSAISCFFFSLLKWHMSRFIDRL